MKQTIIFKKILVGATLFFATTVSQANFTDTYSIVVKQSSDWKVSTYHEGHPVYIDRMMGNEGGPGIKCIQHLQQGMEEFKSRPSVARMLRDFGDAPEKNPKDIKMSFYFVTNRETRDDGGHVLKEFYRPSRVYIKLSTGSTDEVEAGRAVAATFSLAMNDNGTCDTDHIFSLIENQRPVAVGSTTHIEEATYLPNGMPAEQLHTIPEAELPGLIQR